MDAIRLYPSFEVSLRHIARTGAGFERFQCVIQEVGNDTSKVTDRRSQSGEMTQ